MQKRIDSILFVCLGNICRSPLAEGIATDLAKKRGLNITIDSAGTGSWHIGSMPCKNSIKVAKEHGIDISHLRARQVGLDDFYKFDAIVAMDSSNIAALKKIKSDATNIYKLGDFGKNGLDIPDPYYFDDYEGFRDVFKMIYEAISVMMDQFFSRKS